MSEFTKLSKSLDDAAGSLKLQLDEDFLAFSLDEIRNYHNKIVKLNLELVDCSAKCEKYIQKKSQRDDITGALRFGTNMCAKIDKAKENADDLLAVSHDLCQRVDTRLRELLVQESNVSVTDQVSDITELSASAAIHDQQLEQRRHLEMCAIQEQHALLIEQEALHRRAEEIRTLKLQRIDRNRDCLRGMVQVARSRNEVGGDGLRILLDDRLQRVQCFLACWSRLFRQHPFLFCLTIISVLYCFKGV